MSDLHWVFANSVCVLWSSSLPKYLNLDLHRLFPLPFFPTAEQIVLNSQ